MGFFDSIRNTVGAQDKTTGAITTQPFQAIYNKGTLWVGSNKSVWLYMVLPDYPVTFEDASRRLELGGELERALEEIGKLSREPLGNTTVGGRSREIHVITHIWYKVPEPPDKSTPEHAQFLNRIYDFLAPNKATWVGVRLWPETESSEKPNVLGTLQRASASMLGFDLDDVDAYITDYNRIRRILVAADAKTPTTDQRKQLAYWHNAGREGDPTVIAFPEKLVIDNNDNIEFSAVEKFNTIKFNPRTQTWLANALTHPEGAITISIRGELESAGTTRKRLKQTQRKIRHQIEEEEAAVEEGDVESIETTQLAQYNKQVEDYFATNNTPVITKASFVFARRATPAEETFNDLLENAYDIETKVLTHRQIDALEETLPTSPKRSTQSKDSLTIPMVAYSGVRSFSQLGDDDGAFPGVIIPDMVPMYISARAASESNQPPMMTVVGVPGSGKAQALSTSIPTPSGWTTMGELKLGDKVLGRDGKPCTVVHLSPINEKPNLYKITLDDGQEILADGDHQWVVSNRFDRRNPRSAKRRSAVSRWEQAQQTIWDLEKVASSFAPDHTSTVPELFNIVKGVVGVPWGDVKSLRSVLDFMDCPYHVEEREYTRSSSKSETAVRDLPVVLFPVRETLSVLIEQWGSSPNVNAPGGRGVSVRERINVAKEWLGEGECEGEGVDSDLELSMSDICREFGRRGVEITRNQRKEMSKKVKEAGVVGRAGLVRKSIPLKNEISSVREMNVYSTQVALKTLAVRLAQQHSVRPNTNIEERVMTTAEMLAEGVTVGTDDRSNFAIRIAEELQLPEADLLVDPYALGAWLGDGYSANGNICGIDNEIFDKVGRTHRTKEMKVSESHGENLRIVQVVGLKEDLKQLDLLHNKHIPADYLRGSFEQRLALLQGLMDTDGTVDKNGSCELGISDERIMNGALELIRSLGIKASMTMREMSYRYVDRKTGESEIRKAKDNYRINFTTNLPVFHLSRKAERLPTELRETQKWLYVKSIEPVDPVPARCIQVDSPDSTYLCAGFVPTHNTMLLQMLAFQYALLGEQVFFLNPKADDDLTPLAQLTGGNVLNISDAEPGAFDPFRFAKTPELAAEAASDFLLEVLPPENVHDKVAIRVGLARGAKAGGRCVLEALRLGLEDTSFINSVEGLLEASSLFRIAVGTHPREPFRASKSLTLVQFDQGLNLPDPNKNPADYSDGERLALGAQLLITNGGMQALRGEGGVIIVDEAHRWLTNSETLNQLQKLGREGRSQQLFTILATQRLGDVDTSSLLSYSPRVTVMRVEEEDEAVKSLELLGLEPSSERIRWLREDTKAVRGTDETPGRAPLALHRDLHGRHAAFMAGPYPEELMKQFSTNPLDRQKRKAEEEERRFLAYNQEMTRRNIQQNIEQPVLGPTEENEGRMSFEVMGRETGRLPQGSGPPNPRRKDGG